jgi:hypothetical protein
MVMTNPAYSDGEKSVDYSKITKDIAEVATQYLHTIGANSGISVDAEIEADVEQEVTGDNSTAIIEGMSAAGLGKDATVDFDVDFNLELDQTVDGDNSKAYIDWLRIGTPVN